MTVRAPIFGSGSHPRLGANGRCWPDRPADARSGDRGASGATGGRMTRPGDPGVAGGIPHRNRTGGEIADSRAAAAARSGVGRGRVRGPAVLTRSPPLSIATSTAPSVSVRYVRPASSWSRSSVAGAGWPYGLPAPDDTTATDGRTASRNSRVDAVPDPWWATFSRSTCGSPRARSSGSTPSSISPASRNLRPATSPRSTIETLLIPVPVSLGRSGTRLGSGQSTRNRIASRVSRSPVERRPCGGPPSARTADHAS